MEALQPGPPPGSPPSSIGGIRPTAEATTAPAEAPTAEVTITAPPAAITATVPMPTEAAPSSTTAVPEAPTEALIIPTQSSLTSEERWRAQQLDRTVFPQLQQYGTTNSELYWYDPINEQRVLLGVIAGTFSAQAEFTERSTGQAALEVPYRINESYGLTALSPAVLQRIAAAGYTDWIETFVYRAPSVTQR